ncbi:MULTISPECIES: type VI secretion system lipoprotein TssJ [Paracoccus]|uniref:Type VI secretion system protein VasD n=1 Tax=Paracoccus versutus TaxID=34007 RepID=A0A3D9XGY6_PARVE|nr:MULTISPECIES: type VI secretion system lipoprotein TssJ [Paracoccus]REF69765.1 type VI secretion system protein VasD [Paracoccus versutus]WGR57873.1 type VI secretion system lipoprotein TssJ [Paracoccus versutus]
MTTIFPLFTRRATLAGLGTLALTAACGGPQGPGSVNLAMSAAAGVNPGPDGSDRPLTLHILQLRGTAGFDAADTLALQDPAAALGADLVKAETVTLAPGGSAEKALVLDPSTTAVAVVAGYRDPAGKNTRAKAAVSPTGTASFTVTAGPGGVVMAPA